MAVYKPLLTLGVKATAAVEGKRFVTAAGKHAGAGETAIGVSLFGTGIGKQISAIVKGSVVVEAGAIIAEGAKVMSDEDGKAVPLSTRGELLGTALEESIGDGDEIEVLLMIGGAKDSIVYVTASDDVVAKRFISAEGAYAAAGAPGIGVSLADAAETETIPITTAGEAIVIARTEIAVGAPITSGTDGKAVAATAKTNILGRALTAAAKDGDEIKVLLGLAGAKDLVTYVTASDDVVAKRFISAAGAYPGPAEPAIGVSLTDAATESTIEIDSLGLVLVTAAAAIAAGALVATDGDGKAVTATGKNNILGRAVTEAIQAGDDIWLLFGVGGVKDLTIHLVASDDIVAKRFITAAGAYPAAGAIAVGVSLADATNGSAIEVDSVGQVTVSAGDAVSVGAEVASDVEGKAVAATEGDKILGIALIEATQADDDILILFCASGAVVPGAA